MSITTKLNPMGVYKKQNYQNMPLTFKALENNSILSLPQFNTNITSDSHFNLLYKGKLKNYKVSEWTLVRRNSYILDKDDYIQFLYPKYNNELYLYDSFFSNSQDSQGKFKVYGNIQSLLNYNNYVLDNTFQRLFMDNSTIIDASDLFLPGELRNINYSNCYNSMFYNCTNLIYGPKELPAKILQPDCYQYMFCNCTSLIKAPIISAISGAEYACEHMFEGCTSLVDVQSEFNLSIEQQMYKAMFKNCTSLISAPKLNATYINAQGCQNIFEGCTSLINGPEINCTNIQYEALDEMFKGCSSLNNIKVHFTSWNDNKEHIVNPWQSSQFFTWNWVSGVATSGTFYKPNSLPDNRYEGHYIPENWNVVNID